VRGTWSPSATTTTSGSAGGLREQAALLRANRWADVASSAIMVHHHEVVHPRRPRREVVLYSDLLRSRLSWLHSSTLLVRRSEFAGEIGWVDETIPGGRCAAVRCAVTRLNRRAI
jgi:hypothetical protein